MESVWSLPGACGGVVASSGGLMEGNSTFQLAPVPPVITAGVLSGLLVCGEVLRSRHKLETEKSLHLPVLVGVPEVVEDISMVAVVSSERSSSPIFSL